MTAIALTIAGSDSSGGAGIQADLKTFSALGVYGASVITALTAQNTLGVTAIHDVPKGFIRAQMEAVFSDLTINAIKIGMLSQPETIHVIVEALQDHQARNIILDPVMVAASGDPLITDEAVATLRDKLLPHAALITPNLPEAARLTNTPLATNEDDMIAQAHAIQSFGAQAVLIKGGHARAIPGKVDISFPPGIATNLKTSAIPGKVDTGFLIQIAKNQEMRTLKQFNDEREHSHSENSIDLLLNTDGTIKHLSAPRIATNNTHGTGCTLSSAITAGLAKKQTLEETITNAKTYITQAIQSADKLKVGKGHGPVHHFHAWWN